MPERIKRERTRGWRLPAGAVIVDRSSRFGNPFTVADCLEAWPGITEEAAREYCVEMYRDWLKDELCNGCGPEGTRWSEAARDRILVDLPMLRGMDLACPCPLPKPGDPDHCHARVLMEAAAALPEPTSPTTAQETP